MKHIILFLFLLSSTASYAALSPLEALYIEKLQSGSFPEVKTIAKVLHKSEVHNTEVLDTAAELLLQAYPTATSGEIDPIALIARTLGQSENKRYYTVLSEVYENTSSRNLHKHVGIAIQQLKEAEGEQYKKGMVSLPLPRPATDAEKALAQTLKNGDEKNIQAVAKYIIYSNTYHHEIFDAAAETLSKNYPKTDNEDSTTAELLVRVISYSYSNKYDKVFTDIYKTTDNNKLRELVKKSFRYVKTFSDR